MKYQRNHSKIIQRMMKKYLPKKYMSPEKRQEIIVDFRLKLQYNNGISKHNNLVRKYTRSKE